MPTTLQALPPQASRYTTAQRSTIAETLDLAAEQWRRMGTRFDSGWALVGPYIGKAVTDAQGETVERASSFIPAILLATGQAEDAAAEAQPTTLLGLTGAGYPVEASLSVATIRAAQAVGNGATPRAALETAGSWLMGAITTILADTARSAESLERYTRDVGYVRMVNGGACGRCVVLAGRWYRVNADFPRHPECKCGEMPAARDAATDWQTNPDEYFHSLTEAQQIKLMGSKANAQAVLDGADMARLVNAYRKRGGLYTAQQTSAGRIRATKVGFRGQRAGQRLMPETIAKLTTTRDERLKMLRKYGWIL